MAIGELMDQWNADDPAIWWDRERMMSWIGSGSGWRLDWQKVFIDVGAYGEVTTLGYQ